MQDFTVWNQGSEIEPAPAVYTSTTKQTQHAASLVLSVRPQLGNASRQFGAGLYVPWTLHAATISHLTDLDAMPASRR